MPEYMIRANGRICVASGAQGGDFSFCGDADDRIDEDGTFHGDRSGVVVESMRAGGYNCQECRIAISAMIEAASGAEFKQSN